MAVINTGTNALGKANVENLTIDGLPAGYNLQVNPPGVDALGVDRGGGSANAGAAVLFSENDTGGVTGARYVASPETDDDHRLRIAADTLFDQETFNYAAQNFGKHNFLNTTLAAAWQSSGWQTNSGSILTITTGLRLRTYAFFPILGISQTYVEFTGSFNLATVPSSTVVDVGLFIDGGANPFTPTDGAYFRNEPSGFFGVINNNGVESSMALPFTVVPGKKYKFLISIQERTTEFWIDDELYGEIATPDAAGQPFTSAALPFAVRHAIVGAAAGAVFQATISDYSVSVGGSVFAGALSDVGNRMFGAHQGLSGGTSGQLTQYTNNTTTAGAVPTNTTAAAQLTGLGGQFNIIAQAAAVTDFIIQSYQVPAGTISVQGRRLAIRGVRISAVNLVVAVTGTETSHLYTLNFGGTAVSLAGAEAASTKNRRAEALGMLSWPVGAAIGAGPREGSIYMQFAAPIYVNPGEFVQIAMKVLQGTATATESFMHAIVFDYGWE